MINEDFNLNFTKRKYYSNISSDKLLNSSDSIRFELSPSFWNHRYHSISLPNSLQVSGCLISSFNNCFVSQSG